MNKRQSEANSVSNPLDPITANKRFSNRAEDPGDFSSLASIKVLNGAKRYSQNTSTKLFTSQKSSSVFDREVKPLLHLRD